MPYPNWISQALAHEVMLNQNHAQLATAKAGPIIKQGCVNQPYVKAQYRILSSYHQVDMACPKLVVLNVKAWAKS